MKPAYWLVLGIATFSFPIEAGAQAQLHCCLEQSSGSMLPTIPRGTRLQFAPYAGASDITRGDIVVFIAARRGVRLVSRLVGLPGDRIQMISGALHINGKQVARERAEDYVDPDGGSGIERIKRWKETLPNGVVHHTLDVTENSFYDSTSVYVVPPGSYFFVSDNRDNSTDSRVLTEVGYVQLSDIIGRVVGH